VAKQLHFIGEDLIQVEHKFTPAELQDLAKIMAEGMLEVECLEDEKKDHAARLKTAIDAKYEEVTDAARKHRAGHEIQDAKTYQVADYDAGEIVWLDRGTGDVVKKRKMTGEENKIPLTFKPVPALKPEPNPAAKQATLADDAGKKAA